MRRRFFAVLGGLLLLGQGLVLLGLGPLPITALALDRFLQLAYACFLIANVLLVVGGTRSAVAVGSRAFSWRVIVGTAAAVFGVGWFALGANALAVRGGDADVAVLVAGLSSGIAAWLFGLDVASGGRYLALPIED